MHLSGHKTNWGRTQSARNAKANVSIATVLASQMVSLTSGSGYRYAPPSPLGVDLGLVDHRFPRHSRGLE